MNALVQENTITGNSDNGLQISDASAGLSVIDMGGGTLGSTGGNRIFGNTLQDIRVDVDGNEAKAENNWWGVATGLAGGETVLDDASTIDADPFLTTDPNP